MPYYKKINPELFVAILIILCAVVASTPLFHTGYYTSHDGAGHLARLVDYDQAILDGQIPVRIAHKVEFGIGYPYFYFNYPLPYLMAEFFHKLGASFIDSWKLVALMSFILSGLGMYKFSRSFFGPLVSFFGGVSYIFIPYHFANVYVRGNFPEALSLSLVPWVFWSIERIFHKKSYVLFSVIFALFILSHNTTVAIFTPALLFYILFVHHSELKEVWKNIFFGFFTSLLLTAFFWVPVVFYTHDIIIGLLKLDYPKNFINPTKIIYSPWAFGGSNVGIERGEMSLQIGLAYTLIFLLSLGIFGIKIWKGKLDQKTWPIFFIVITLVSVLIMIDPIGRPIWALISPLQQLQFPWRFLGLTTFSICCLGIWAINTLKPQLRIVAIFLLLTIIFYASRNQIRVNEYTNPNLVYDIYPQSSTTQEHLPVWSTRNFLQQSEWNGTIFGQGSSKRIIWKSNLHQFIVHMDNNGMFQDNTVYMPGWRVFVDDKEAQIHYLDPESLGRLLVNIKKGDHVVISRFEESDIDKVGDTITLMSVFLLVFFISTQKTRFLVHRSL